MASLITLPAELLLQITSHLEDRSGSLHSLSLVCRELRLIAQEALYTSPTLPCPTEEDQSEVIPSDTAPSKAFKFLTTLLSRMDFAARVKKLTIACQRRDLQHRRDCHRNRILGAHNQCICGMTNTLTLAKDTLQRMGIDTTNWSAWIGNCREPSLVGIILYLVPNLTDLDIHSAGALWNNSTTSRYLKLGMFSSFNYFGERGSFRIYDDPNSGTFRIVGNYSTIPGFANLRSLTANDLIPYKMLQLPSLEKVNFGWDISSERHSLYPDMNPPDSWMPSATITEITIHCDVTLMENESNSMSRRRQYLETLTSHLPALRVFRIFILNPHGPYPWRSAGAPEWNDLILSIRGAAGTLEELLIYDESAVKELKETHLMRLLPFTSLKHIVAPERAFTEWPGRWKLRLSRLPPSIETIEVQCFTKEPNYLAKMFFDARRHIPNCKTIIFHLRMHHRYRNHETEIFSEDVELRKEFANFNIEFITKPSMMWYEN
jgi:hypothetical protein